MTQFKKQKGVSAMKPTKEQKKQREIERLLREKSKPKGRGYMAYFMFIISVICLADEVVSQISSQMQTVIASQVFAPIVGEEFAVARMSALGYVSFIFVILAIIYKPLCDRFGRRPFLIINTLGMGLGAILIAVSTNIPVYLIGSCVITFFVPHDMQSVYIQECAPAKHRARIFFIIKAIGTIGVFLIPVLRSIFIPGNDLTNWRYVFLVPGLIALIAGVFAWIFVRESDAFIDTRLRQLQMTDEEIAEAKAKKQEAVQAQGGLIQAIKYGFSNKQVRWLLISAALLAFAMIVSSYYEAIMTNGYAQRFLAQGMTLDAARKEANVYVTKALMLFSWGSALFFLLSGFFADKLGRKRAVIIMCIMLITTYLLFYIGANHFWNPYVVGLLCGAAVGSCWCCGDVVSLMLSESTPTNLRASMISVYGMICAGVLVVVGVVTTVLINILGDAYIGICSLCTMLPGLLIGLIVLMCKARETNGVDMGAVTGYE